MGQSVALAALLAVCAATFAAWIVGRSQRDAVAAVSGYLALLFVIPASWVVPGLGGIGTPALLLGVVLAAWWGIGWLDPLYGLARGIHPVRYAVLFHGWFMVLGYAVAHMRPLTQLEASGSNRALVTLVGLSGVALLVADGVESRARLDTLFRRIVFAGAFLAGIGIFQFFTGMDIAAQIRIPGLVLNREFHGVLGRSFFHRPAGTTLHPIEFSVVLATILPLAIHYTFVRPPGREKQSAWAQLLLIAAAIPMSVSRSGILGVVLVLPILAVGWTWRRRINALAFSIAFTVVMWATVPGLIGTLRNLFLRYETDPSIQARQDRIPIVQDLVAEAPWLGRGSGTFSVEDYLLLDNEWFQIAIESGVIGVLVVIAVLIVPMVCLAGVRRRSVDDPETRHLSLAITASLVVVFVSLGTFDAFFYRIFSGLAYLYVGAAGALWRLQVRDSTSASLEDDWRAPALAGLK